MAGRPVRVAIVADWIIGGGAERVVEALHTQYPDAPIYASYCSPQWQQKLDNKVVTGYLQYWPFSALRKFVGILRIQWYKKLDFSNFDVVITCTGNGEAKHIRTSGKTKHVSYCFTPVHYYWRHYQTYLQNPGFGPFNWLARAGLQLLLEPLKKKDYQAAQKVDEFIAISTHIQKDIKQYYHRDSTVIAPPVNVDRFASVNQPMNKRNGFITVGRQTAVKHTEVIVDACTRLELPLTVIGNGPEHAELIKRAGATVSFPERVSDEALPEYLANASAFLFASEEDFGIAPVEAMACGTPVIAYKAGGALDYVTAETGIFFDQQTDLSLEATLQTFIPASFSPPVIRKHAQKFSTDRFLSAIQKHIES